MNKNSKAFTLIELIIVITIIGILASIALVRYGPVLEHARSAEAMATLSEIAASERAYYLDYDGYTATWSLLDRFDTAPVSDSFTYSVDTSGKYAQALSSSATGMSYGMCLGSATNWSCAAGASDCAPPSGISCP